jgi:hypothetical protein
MKQREKLTGSPARARMSAGDSILLVGLVGRHFCLVPSPLPDKKARFEDAFLLEQREARHQARLGPTLGEPPRMGCSLCKWANRGAESRASITEAVVGCEPRSSGQERETNGSPGNSSASAVTPFDGASVEGGQGAGVGMGWRLDQTAGRAVAEGYLLKSHGQCNGNHPQSVQSRHRLTENVPRSDVLEARHPTRHPTRKHGVQQREQQLRERNGDPRPGSQPSRPSSCTSDVLADGRIESRRPFPSTALPRFRLVQPRPLPGRRGSRCLSATAHLQSMVGAQGCGMAATPRGDRLCDFLLADDASHQ